LKKVLVKISNSGITLKLKKCSFAKPKFQFLGHIVGSGGISVVNSKVEVIKNMPEPTYKKTT